MIATATTGGTRKLPAALVPACICFVLLHMLLTFPPLDSQQTCKFNILNFVLSTRRVVALTSCNLQYSSSDPTQQTTYKLICTVGQGGFACAMRSWPLLLSTFSLSFFLSTSFAFDALWGNS